MGRLADVALRASGRVARVAPCVDMPQGRRVELAGRGATYLVDTGQVPISAGREQPTLILLHALACTGLLTWYPAISVLRERYRVVTFDQRWHGQGIVSDRFTLEDCADDAVAVADHLGIDRFIAVGYSMGSLVAQLTWRRHADRLAGAVLCASTARFVEPRRDPAAFRLVSDRISRAATGRIVAARAATAAQPVQPWQPGQPGQPSQPGQPWQPGTEPNRWADNRWALDQFRSTTGRRIAAAAAQISRFDSSDWIGELDVPTAVVVTTRDKLIPPASQQWLARQIPDTSVYDVDAGHAACVLRADRFTPALQAACASVSARAAAAALAQP